MTMKILYYSTFPILILVFSVLTTVAVASGPVADATDLITCPDSSSVYYLHSNDNGEIERWVFPNSSTFHTWYSNFDAVIDVPCERLADWSLSGIVTYQPGTRLVKIQSVPNVYAVEPGGVLRWIQDESTAERIYGLNWQSRVDDVPVGFFSSYTVGESFAPIMIVPAGTTLFNVESVGSGEGFTYSYMGVDGVLYDVSGRIDEVMNDWSLFNPNLGTSEVMTDEKWTSVKNLVTQGRNIEQL